MLWKDLVFRLACRFHKGKAEEETGINNNKCILPILYLDLGLQLQKNSINPGTDGRRS